MTALANIATRGGMIDLTSNVDALTEGESARRGLWAVLAELAVRTPAAPALLAPGRAPLTYAALWELVQATAMTLDGVLDDSGGIVATLIPSGPEAAAAFLAIACSAACAPLNPALKGRELEARLAALQPRAVVVAKDAPQDVRAVVSKLRCAMITAAVDPASAAGAFELSGAGAAARAPRFSTGRDTALVLTTSGTTAEPKLVPLTHENLAASARAIADWLKLSSSDRCLAVMPLFHIHGLIGSVLSSILGGGAVVCGGAFRSSQFFEQIDAFRPSWYTAVPTIHQAVLAQARRDPARAAGSFRFIRSCSASLAPSTAAELERFFEAPVVEAYGMTEASHQVACNPLPPSRRKLGSVGLPTGSEIRVVRKDGSIAAPNESGEIHVRGPGLSPGYLGDPPGADMFAGGWFRSGDLGRLDEEGYLFLEGRIKEVINRAGEKISPREIEEAVLEHPAVAEAAAFAIPDRRLGETVGLAATLREGKSVADEELREFVASRVSRTKVPRRIIVVPSIPKGPTGKLQRIGLARVLGLEGIQPPLPSPARRDPATETALAALWRQVLRVPRVTPEDDFFELGGDSLAATELASRAERLTGARLSPAALFNAPTLGAFATLIACSDARLREPRVAVVQAGGAYRPFFCVSAGPMYRALAAAIGPARPFLSLYCPDARVLPQPYRIEDLAAYHIETMRDMQPEGPYLLAGWCASGIVAYEMAIQLQARGERVGALVLFDAANPATPSRRRAPALIDPAPAEAARNPIWVEARWAATRLRRIAAAASYAAAVRLKLPVHQQDADFARDLALRRYVPGYYEGSALIFRRSEDLAGRYVETQLGWESHIRELEVHAVPGGHRSMLQEPQVVQVGAAIRSRIEAAEAESSSHAAWFRSSARKFKMNNGGSFKSFAGEPWTLVKQN